MYTPKLRDDQVRSLYQLKLKVKRPMTILVREAIDQYLKQSSDLLENPGDKQKPNSKRRV